MGALASVYEQRAASVVAPPATRPSACWCGGSSGNASGQGFPASWPSAPGKPAKRLSKVWFSWIKTRIVSMRSAAVAVAVGAAVALGKAVADGVTVTVGLGGTSVGAVVLVAA